MQSNAQKLLNSFLIFVCMMQDVRAQTDPCDILCVCMIQAASSVVVSEWESFPPGGHSPSIIAS